MSCNSDIHEELSEFGDVVCCFCDKQLLDVLNNKDDICCENMY